MRTRLILGGPGAGKTHRLLSIVEEELKRGVPSYVIAFVSFTRKAVGEAVARAQTTLGIDPKQAPYFKTLHALCYAQLGVKQGGILTRADLGIIGSHLNVSLLGNTSLSDDSDLSLGDQLLALDNYARLTGKSVKAAWQERGGNTPWVRQEQFSATLANYKERRGKLDFTDLLVLFRDRGLSVHAEVAIIDEAQDLTPLQWDVVDVAFKDVDRLYVAGDDDQAIYEWSGADVERFTNLHHNELEILSQSRRLKSNMVTHSRKVIARVKGKRYKKELKPVANGGVIEHGLPLQSIDFSAKGTWLLLARNKCHLRYLEDECRKQGVAYTSKFGSSIDEDEVRAIYAYEKKRAGKQLTQEELKFAAEKLDTVKTYDSLWHEALVKIPVKRRAYYLAVLRKGGSLAKPPRVHIDTIHGVKGGEADNIVVLPDQTTATERGARKAPDAETRVFYVAVTRAKERLIIAEPITGTYFKVPR